MKKLYSILLLALSAAFSVSGQNRTVLHEEITSAGCNPCLTINNSFWPFCDTMGVHTKFLHITYLKDVVTPTLLYFSAVYNNVDLRNTYYGVPFTPYGRLDGAVPDPSATYPGEPNYLTAADIDTEAAIHSPINITATHHFNAAQDTLASDYGRDRDRDVSQAIGT